MLQMVKNKTEKIFDLVILIEIFLTLCKVIRKRIAELSFIFINKNVGKNDYRINVLACDSQYMLVRFQRLHIDCVILCSLMIPNRSREGERYID